VLRFVNSSGPYDGDYSNRWERSHQDGDEQAHH
jgi:hypothetical protein